MDLHFKVVYLAHAYWTHILELMESAIRSPGASVWLNKWDHSLMFMGNWVSTADLLVKRLLEQQVPERPETPFINIHTFTLDSTSEANWVNNGRQSLWNADPVTHTLSNTCSCAQLGHLDLAYLSLHHPHPRQPPAAGLLLIGSGVNLHEKDQVS